MKFLTAATLLTIASSTVAAPALVKDVQPLQIKDLNMRYNKGISMVQVNFDLYDPNNQDHNANSFHCAVNLEPNRPENRNIDKPCDNTQYDFGFPSDVKNIRDVNLKIRNLGASPFWGARAISAEVPGSSWQCYDNNTIPASPYTSCSWAGIMEFDVSAE
ncbi:hypothetical protein EYZ11_010879 [Aspergillus tanneri]|uniref:AA1-like domain-containing protein n=1 Tax=Aspergillus tanneri TaxID=1220188 RepID=A0A4S3J6E1_9EURO|nr:uncharacterized protein ATNIH1004_003718 [Aspergillus tanneri]KAA8651027.1 hypothetical protein ATNIH1004_003718 [Aspergillus tanneri]THC89668.1 hypothetical protein EYZ11_010879 [Aspergillus tanneri]